MQWLNRIRPNAIALGLAALAISGLGMHMGYADQSFMLASFVAGIAVKIIDLDRKENDS